MTLKCMQDIDLSDKSVLLRLDLNVPFDNEGNITETTRIQRVKSTIDYLKDKAKKIVILTHLGRPKGQKNDDLSVKKIIPKCEDIWGVEIVYQDDMNALCDSQFIMLENMRFWKEEEDNGEIFSHYLAELGDVYINDAFSCAHRAHASTEGITHHLPSYAGLSFQKEIEAIDKALSSKETPKTAIIGGAKISTKLDVLHNFIEMMDTVIVGGGMANTFLVAQNYNVGQSLVENDMISNAKEILDKAGEHHCTIYVPYYVMASDDFDNPKHTYEGAVSDMPDDHMIMDIAGQSIDDIKEIIGNSKTLLWNGPVGVFEKDQFDKGTMAIAHTIADRVKNYGLNAVAGGGDTLAAIDKAGLGKSDFTYLSTAGGAFLEYCEGKELPGVKALKV